MTASDAIAVLKERLERARGSDRIPLLIELSDATRRSRPDRATAAAREAVDLSRESGDETTLARALTQFGLSLLDQGECARSVEHLLEASRLAETRGDRRGLATALNNLGLAHFVWKSFDRALEFQSRALAIWEEIDDRGGLAATHNGLGLVLAQGEDREGALDHFRQALALAREVGNQRLILSCQNNIGLIFQGLGDHEEALRHFEATLPVKRELGDRRGTAGALINMGASLGRLGQTDAARGCFREGLTVAEEVDALDFLIAGYDDLSMLEEEVGDHHAALTAAKRGAAVRERLFDLEQSRSIAEMRTRYETERIEREAELQRLRNLELAHQLHQSQKMEAVGRLAGGIAHDFNNLLTAITGFTELLLDSFDGDDPRRGNVKQIQKASDRAATLTRQLLAFSRKQVVEPTVLDLSATVSDLESMLRRLLGEDVDLTTDLDPGTGCVLADGGQIEQVVVNLAVNARDAMTGGGRLIIATLASQLDDVAAGALDLAPGPYVRLSVTDTGCGMDAGTRARAFEPFFSTKSRDKGTGLGLSTVYGIVHQSRGAVRIDSQPDHGTTVEIHLPRVGDRVATGEIPDRPAPERGGDETILIVEDDETVRDITRDLLIGCGYRVLTAPSGERALEIAGSHDGPIHLLLTDIVLPGIGGADLASRLTDRTPGARVLFMSGYPDDSVRDRGALPAGTRLLAKPFGTQVLARRVREALDRT